MFSAYNAMLVLFITSMICQTNHCFKKAANMDNKCPLLWYCQ